MFKLVISRLLFVKTLLFIIYADSMNLGELFVMLLVIAVNLCNGYGHE